MRHTRQRGVAWNGDVACLPAEQRLSAWLVGNDHVA